MFEIKPISYKKANNPTTIRFTDELFIELKDVAANAGVSFNSLVLQACEYALKNLPEELKTPQK